MVFLGSQAAPQPAFSLMGIEGALTILTVAASFAWPRLTERFFDSVASRLKRLIPKRLLSLVVISVVPLLIRLLVLPVHPIPMPFAPDDFSNLLGVWRRDEE